MSQLSRLSTNDEKSQIILTAHECLERFRIIRQNNIDTREEDESEQARKAFYNMKNLCDHMEQVLIESFIPDEKPTVCDRKGYSYICIIILDSIILKRNNTYERFIYHYLMDRYIKSQEAEGRSDVAKLMSLIGTQRFEVSKIAERIKSSESASPSEKEAMLEDAIKNSAARGFIRDTEEVYKEEFKLASLTQYEKYYFGEEKSESEEEEVVSDEEGSDEEESEEDVADVEGVDMEESDEESDKEGSEEDVADVAVVEMEE